MFFINWFIDSKKLYAFIFFFVLFIIGLSVFSDYGVHLDEYNNQYCGNRFFEYVKSFNILKPIPYNIDFEKKTHDSIHGPTFEIFLIFLAKKLGIVDSRDIILMRHLSTFMIFYIGVFFFYCLGKYILKSRGMSLLGCVMLVLHPRIFAHAFYNSVDIPFLSFYIISTYTLFRYFEKKNLLWAFLHALTCAMLCGVRITGVFIPILTVVVILIKESGGGKLRKTLGSLITFVSLYLILTILFNPLFWTDPLGNFFKANYNSVYNNLQQVHWYYNFVWILVTTPLSYILLFLIGCCILIANLFNKKLFLTEVWFLNLIVFLLFFIPLIVPIVIKSLLFNEWRHHYFIYPMIVLISLMGVREGLSLIKATVIKENFILIRNGILGIVLVCLVSAVISMSRLHPYEHIYSNFLKEIPWVEQFCEYKYMWSIPDYWELSIKEAFEYILLNDQRNKVKVFPIQFAHAYQFLTREDRLRVVIINKLTDADYVVVESPLNNKDFSEYYVIKAGGKVLRRVYKRTVGESNLFNSK